MYDVIIIGSGLGGLISACILSKAGLKVLVLEREKQPGGCMQSYRRKDLCYDTGFHYIGGLGEGQSLHNIFSRLGLMELPWKRMDKDCIEEIHTIYGTYRLPEGFNNYSFMLTEKFPDQKEGIMAYTSMLKDTVEKQNALFSGNPEEILSIQQSFTVSAWKYLNDTLHSHKLVDIVSAPAMKVELRKESLPLFTFAHSHASCIESGWRLKGNGNMLVNHLCKIIRDNGGEITCNAEVEELIETNGIISSALCSNGNIYNSKMFISDIHPSLTCNLVKGGKTLRRIYRKRMESLENTFGMFTLSLRIKNGAIPYFNHNKYVYSTSDLWDFYRNSDIINGIMISCRIPENNSAFAQQIDILTPVTYGQLTKWNNTLSGRRGKEYEEWKKIIAEECLDLAGRALPGITSAIVEQYASTPLTYRDYTLSPNGSAFGVRKDFHHPLQTILTPRTPISNLLMTGQSLILHGVHGVTMTALTTCAEILGKEKIFKDYIL